MRDADRIEPSRPRWPTFRRGRTPLSLGAGLAVLLLLGGCRPDDVGNGAETGVTSGGASAFIEAGGAFPDGWPFAADDAPVTATEGMVASTDEFASRVGVEILAAGGNAVDAAVATGLALAVVNPEAGNLGGGGFMMVRLADGTVFAQDHREKAPLAATRDMYLDEDGNVTDLSVLGHLAAGVPGTVSGLWEAHRRFGSLPWADIVQPSIDLAHGFEVTTRLVSTLDAAQEGIRAFPHSARIFLPGDAVPGIGGTFSQPDLAAVLTRLRDEGPDDFYRGETAALIVEEMERGGGIITLEDLDRYETVWRDPVAFDYRGYTVHSMPPPSSGGLTMAAIANILERWDLGAMGWNSPETIHVMAESFRRAYADRNEYLADPDFVELPVDEFLSEAYADSRAATISAEGATPSAEVNPGIDAFLDESHTTHYAVVDAEGNAVAVTTSINSWYGGKVVVEGAGFFLNNTMDDFASKPGTPNQFGLVQGERNAIGPGKRMLSAMSPTIVEDAEGDLFLVTGTPGGATIITTVLQSIFNVVDHGMNVVQAVHAPRVHHQHLPDLVFHEYGGLGGATASALEALGHTVRERDPGPPDAYFTGGMSGDLQLIMAMPDGSWTAWSDPRRGGTALGR
ncbi:gamma-glutamyltransferase [Candidatus Palauibacter polyketidifaciens]|uniref:gamma-glutamyltransferase n=1 Tax=Candidatus Palauibacter polyketidifaciens TaxID=3056740 RepID=UPI002386755B|nr:gamma-glutamyltransferase [Candidatus Palauibacter polyketidifaciens]MDE2719296.1 gamma-glutamyltransferase [Candidatus Palauibacter polyketidifaciens]